MDFSGNWDKNKYLEYVNYLIKIKEEKYREFNLKIVFTNYKMLGIRLPILRKIAKDIYNNDYKSFLDIAEFNYYEEVMIYLLVIAFIKEIDLLMIYFDKAVGLMDNWALCDSFCGSLKIIDKNKEYFLKVIDDLLKSKKTYKIRVGLVLLLNYYVKEEYLKIIFNYLYNIKSDEYYVNMEKALLLSVIFIKYQDHALKYLKNNKLDNFTINKAISKIRDSYRVEKKVKEQILQYKKS